MVGPVNLTGCQVEATPQDAGLPSAGAFQSASPELQQQMSVHRVREKVDTKILETLVELDPGANPLDGLRVDAFIVPDGGE